MRCLLTVVHCSSHYHRNCSLYLPVNFDGATILCIRKTNDATHFTLGRIFDGHRHFEKLQNKVKQPFGDKIQLTPKRMKELMYDML